MIFTRLNHGTLSETVVVKPVDGLGQEPMGPSMEPMWTSLKMMCR